MVFPVELSCRESNWACGVIGSLVKDILRMHSTKSLEVPESFFF